MKDRLFIEIIADQYTVRAECKYTHLFICSVPTYVGKNRSMEIVAECVEAFIRTQDLHQ